MNRTWVALGLAGSVAVLTVSLIWWLFAPPSPSGEETRRGALSEAPRPSPTRLRSPNDAPTRPETKEPEAKPETKPEAKEPAPTPAPPPPPPPPAAPEPEAKPEVKPEAKEPAPAPAPPPPPPPAAPEPEAKPETKPEAKEPAPTPAPPPAAPEPEAKPETKPEAKEPAPAPAPPPAAPEPEAKPETKPEAKEPAPAPAPPPAAPEPEAKPETKPEAKEPASGGAAVVILPEPETPTAEDPAEDSAAENSAIAAEPAFDVVRVTREGSAVLAGRAEPDSTVIIRDNAEILATVKASPEGEWVLIPERTFTPGPHELTLEARKIDQPSPPTDSPPAATERSVIVMVPAPAAAPGAAPPPVVMIEVSRTGEGPSLLRPESAPPVKDRGRVAVESVDYSDTGTVRFGGRAAPGREVWLYLDNLPLGRAHADPAGRWNLRPEAPVALGSHTLRADQVTSGGQVAARAELPVQIAPFPPFAPEVRLVVQPGNNLWRLARRLYGKGNLYTQIYLANREQIRDPRKIYPGQVFLLPQEPPRLPPAATPPCADCKAD